MAFANILDISSFFIGMLINLLLIALICYYFKRKYESLELAQNEQAKILYNLIQQQQPRKQFNMDDIQNHVVENINLDKDKMVDSDSDSNSDSDSDSDEELETKTKTIILDVDELETKTIMIDEIVNIEDIEDIEVKVEVEVEEIIVTKIDDYSKMTIKELKDVLSKKGISSSNKMKKNDLIQLIETGAQDTLNLSEELSEVNI